MSVEDSANTPKRQEAKSIIRGLARGPGKSLSDAASKSKPALQSRSSVDLPYSVLQGHTALLHRAQTGFAPMKPPSPSASPQLRWRRGKRMRQQQRVVSDRMKREAGAALVFVLGVAIGFIALFGFYCCRDLEAM
ncbi:hypothetical protein AC579_5669 [Pseudocercospora musae]|uniref:Uncharacterized protein n=1 Tax=Pseudocercospora musae TaxID=113226 RepID=A0A139ICG5_9PEZI|nr:hypothetical protein AC579_5669 [Pseudocercospora musae]